MLDLRGFTLWARKLLTEEAADLLQEVYGLDSSGTFRPVKERPAMARSSEAMDTRRRLEKLIDDEVDAGLSRHDAVAKLIRETAFTHLNRFVAFKLMEARSLIRSPLSKVHESNGFKMYLGDQQEDEDLYKQGAMPQDDLGEGPRDRAYRHFLLWQCQTLAREIRVLFDRDNLPSRLFPRPRPLRELIDALNSEERKGDWATGNEETVGWVYQYFIAEEKAAAFDKVFKKKKKFEKDDVPAATQVFTPRWIVRFLVENSLGRLWLSMHPDSSISAEMEYLVPLRDPSPNRPLKAIREIRLLDPATGTMHFGLVAFDLLVKMYREEIARVGQPGWPVEPSVEREDQIPAAILANNLFGIDIDLRAVQLAALALYLRAKAHNKNASLTESNLACADVAIFRGQHLAAITQEMALPSGVTRDLFQRFRDNLEEACMMGSLVRLDQHFQNLQSDQLRNSIDTYVDKKRSEGIDESYFAQETGKGLRLLKLLESRYDIVFTNPPYMSSRNMNPAMSQFLKRPRNYDKSKGDLYSAFIERCTELLAPDGRLAMITQQSFMFISTYEDLRNLLLGRTVVEAMLHLGPRAFPEVTGEKVNTTAFVLRQEQFEMNRREACGVYFRLVKEPNAESKQFAFEESLARRRNGRSDSHVYEYLQAAFSSIKSSPWVYNLSSSLRNLFSELGPLEKFAEPRQGLATADNPRFIRNWWEVHRTDIRFGCESLNECLSAPERWYPHMKGGGSTRWYGQQRSIINYGQNGAELKAWADPLYGNSGWSRIIKSTDKYFHPGITYTAVSGKTFSCRIMPQGFCFDSAGDCLFVEAAGKTQWFLGLLNSKFIRGLMTTLNPTLNVNVLDLRRLPIPEADSPLLTNHAGKAVDLVRDFSREDETTYDFVAPPGWADGTERITNRNRDLAKLESEMDDEVFRIYAVSPEDRRDIEEQLSATIEADADDQEDLSESSDEPSEVEETFALSQRDLAERWISYALGIAVGRFEPGRPGSIGRGAFTDTLNNKLRSLIDPDGVSILQRNHPDDLAGRVIAILGSIYGDTDVDQIIRTVIGSSGDLRDTLADYLIGPFFKTHVKRYQKRPVYWLLQSSDQTFSVYLFHERATDQTLAVLQGNRYLGARMFQLRQQLGEAKQREAASEGRDRARWNQRARELAEELQDLEAFDQAITDTNNEPIVSRDGRAAMARWVPEPDDGIILNAAPLYRLMPAWKRADPKLDLIKAWNALKDGKYPWAKSSMRYWPRETLAACKDNKSYRIAHGLE